MFAPHVSKVRDFRRDVGEILRAQHILGVLPRNLGEFRVGASGPSVRFVLCYKRHTRLQIRLWGTLGGVGQRTRSFDSV